MSILRSAATALRAENSKLRADNAGLRSRRLASGRVGDRGPLEVLLPLDARAPGAARIFVAQCLPQGVAASRLESAKLLASELVTNSVRHSGTSRGDGVVVRVHATDNTFRIEVEDRGRGGPIAPRTLDPDNGGGFGLNLVQALSHRWGLERVADRGTRVWAELPHVPAGVAEPDGAAWISGGEEHAPRTPRSPYARSARSNGRTEVHVVPDERRATWRVYDTEADVQLSEHASATEAQFTAHARAADCHAERVVVHDRYHRTQHAHT